jgi:phospholipid/cholesterol/gamma-HCH transport system substrate-binding protein
VTGLGDAKWADDKRQLTLVALVGIVAVLVAGGVFAVSKLGSGRTVTAYFSSAAALFEDNSVDVLGVPVGKIDKVTPQGDRVKVDMTITDKDVKLPAAVNAAVVSPSLVTGRNVSLFPTWTSGPELASGAVIPIERTAVPLGVDDLAKSATKLATALGPDGANKDGALNDALNVAASNLDGNGQAINDTIKNLGALGNTLNGSSDDLFGTVTELQKFTAMLRANDSAVREFNGRLADVTGTLADQRQQLGDALNELATALDDLTTFIKDNRAAIKSNTDKLVEVTQTIVQQRKALAETLDVAPLALGNLANSYNASSGTLDTRANLNELMNPPILTICKLLATGAPTLPIGNVDLNAVCKALSPTLDGTLGLPTIQQVLTAIQSGTLPPVPGLALPTAPLSGTAAGDAAAPTTTTPGTAPSTAPATGAKPGATSGSTSAPSSGATPTTSNSGGLLGGLLGGGG